MPQEPVRSAPARSGTIYLCRNDSGGQFWASSHCNQHQALIVRMANVPPGLPFDQQVDIAQQQRQEAAANVQAEVAPVPAAPQAVSNKAACRALDARVEELDAMARQPHSAQTQDWIRSERKLARDKQFSLRC